MHTSFVAWAVTGVCGLALLGLVVHAANTFVLIVLHWRHRPTSWPPPSSPSSLVETSPGPFVAQALPDALPVVTVQLPLFNERYVAARMLQAVAALDYPADRLEIQVLDDSTDDTPEIVGGAVATLRARGLDAVHLRRPVRAGFKAGALAAGLARARGELVAIFDGDFVPPRDFLKGLVPFFEPGVAAVQARWGHLNRSFSALTRAAALAIDRHFGLEQPARAWSGLFLTFDGTAGLWRKRAIEDAGGWQSDTITEDLDLAYRAQLRGWKIVYRPEIVCPAELPATVTAFKPQQRRWARGHVQTARKLFRAIVSAPVSGWQKLQAVMHLASYVPAALMLAIVVVTPSLHSWIEASDRADAWWRVVGGALAFAIVAQASALIYAGRAIGAPWWRLARHLPLALVFDAGISLALTRALVGAFGRRSREFVRTPKFGITGDDRTWLALREQGGASWGWLAELTLGVYCATFAWQLATLPIAPFLVLHAVGLLTVGAVTLTESLVMPPEGVGRPYVLTPPSSTASSSNAAAISARV
jgi:cellulose synthase/poly-beta-1,6-N-acetylglucosamine synthase-like glycosyltransferase